MGLILLIVLIVLLFGGGGYGYSRYGYGGGIGIGGILLIVLIVYLLFGYSRFWQLGRVARAGSPSGHAGSRHSCESGRLGESYRPK
jgi:hypothetical protein